VTDVFSLAKTRFVPFGVDRPVSEISDEMHGSPPSFLPDFRLKHS